MPTLYAPAQLHQNADELSNRHFEDNDTLVQNEEGLCYRRFEAKDIYYNMKHEHRGLSIIFNHEKFDGGLSTRSGTMKDRDRLQSVLTNLGFKVEVCDNFKHKDIFNYIHKVAMQDHSRNDCLLIIVLTHGELGTLYAKDRDYKLSNLWSFFTDENCPSLVGKPKIFFIQACRGINYDNGITLIPDHVETHENIYHHDSNFVVSTSSIDYPWTHPDFLICFSTAAEYYSWRNKTDGSWFIQSLCKILEDHVMDYDIMTILTLVSCKVATEFESYTPGHLESDGKKAIPTTQSTLTRILHFDMCSNQDTTDANSLPRWLTFIISFFHNIFSKCFYNKRNS